KRSGDGKIRSRRQKISVSLETEKLLDEWLQFLKLEKGLSANTLAAYESDLRVFLNFLSKSGLPLPALTHAHLTRFLFDQKDQGKSAATLIRYIESVRQFFKYSISEG